jgi:hypothetical protein
VLKGSAIRKRYVLVTGNSLDEILPSIDRELLKIFRAKRKFYDGAYAIYLTDQFMKEMLIEHLKKSFPGIKTVITSGTIKKCKAAIKKLAEDNA